MTAETITGQEGIIEEGPVIDPGAATNTGDGFRAPGGTIWGFPKGVMLLSFTEMWERFSYFGLMAILVLFLTATVAEGGFGWAEPDALKLYGLYSGLAFTVPLLGGWIANNFWGERRCVFIGGLLIAAGHICLAGPKVIPDIAASFSAIDYHQLWLTANINLGSLFSDDTQQALQNTAGAVGVDAGNSQLVYRLIALSFFAGLGLIISGTALLKPTISSIIGRFYSATDRRRDSAFALFLVGIYFGEIGGVFITGYLGEKVAWHWGFSAACVGMTFGLLVYLSQQSKYLADIGVKPVGGGQKTLTMLKELSSKEVDRIKVIFILAAFTAVYSAAVFQNGGLLTLFAKDYVDRERWGWEIPASWFMMITSIFFVIFTPIAAKYWEKLEAKGKNPKTTTKLAGGLLAIGLGYVLVAWIMFVIIGDTDTKVSPMWLIVMYIFMGVSEVLVWTGQLSITSRLAPKNFSAVFIGGWYVNIGVGTWITGYVGAMGYTWGIGSVFALIAAVCVASTVFILLINTWLTKKMHGIE